MTSKGGVGSDPAAQAALRDGAYEMENVDSTTENLNALQRPRTTSGGGRFALMRHHPHHHPNDGSNRYGNLDSTDSIPDVAADQSVFVVGDDPVAMTTPPTPASRMAASQAGKPLDKGQAARRLSELHETTKSRAGAAGAMLPPLPPQEPVFAVFNAERQVIEYPTLHHFLGTDGEKLFSGFFWLDITAPTQEDMNAIESVFGIHPLTSEDVLTDFTREKAELYDNYLFLVIQTFSSSVGEDLAEASNICVAVFQDFVITFHKKPRLQLIQNVRGVLKDPTAPLRSDWVLMCVIDDVADELAPVVDSSEREVDAIEEVIFYLSENDRSEVLYRIANARKRITSVNRSIRPKKEMLLYLTGGGRAPPMYVQQATVLYFRDILDLVQSMMTKADASRDVLNSTQSNYLAQVSVEMMQASMDTSNSLNKLTALSTVFLPLNLVAGMFGMNVTGPWYGQETVGWWFLIAGLMFVFGTLAFLVMKKMKFF